MNFNQAISTDLKVINELQHLDYKPGDALLYQIEYSLTEEQERGFPGYKSIKPDIFLEDFENKLEKMFLKTEWGM